MFLAAHLVGNLTIVLVSFADSSQPKNTISRWLDLDFLFTLATSLIENSIEFSWALLSVNCLRRNHHNLGGSRDHPLRAAMIWQLHQLGTLTP
jgi:hypothetical protein